MTDNKEDVDATLKALQSQFEEAGQGHVFKFLNQLSKEEKGELVQSLQTIDPLEATKDFAAIGEKKESEKIELFDGDTCIFNECSPAEQKQYYEHGLKLIGEGKIGLLLMAGGQGTRLGSSEPKGMFDIGLDSHKTLFQLQAEQVQRLQVLSGKHTGNADVVVPWYLITSEATHAPTIAYFKANNFFGLKEKNVYFAKQGVNPCLTNEGKIIMETKSKVAVSPNGNGGLHAAVRTSGSLDDMKTRGVDYVHCYGVDNVLVKLADPSFIGYSALKDCDSCNMVVLKEEPHEKVGVMCLRGGMPSVVEYSEITAEMAEQRDVAGRLVFSGGNIANHLFRVSFLDEVASVAKLPLHIAKKKIPYVNDEGTRVVPDTENGIKMEMFVFDVFSMTKKIVCFAVKRETHFSPVKNKPGTKGEPFVKDSPDTARRDYSNFCISLVEAAGGKVVPSADSYASFEVSPLTSYAGEDLKDLVKDNTFTMPGRL